MISCSVLSWEIRNFANLFLERILTIKISRIEYPKSQETIDISADAKSVRLDIYVEDGRKFKAALNVYSELNINMDMVLSEVERNRLQYWNADNWE